MPLASTTSPKADHARSSVIHETSARSPGCNSETPRSNEQRRSEKASSSSNSRPQNSSAFAWGRPSWAIPEGALGVEMGFEKWDIALLQQKKYPRFPQQGREKNLTQRRKTQRKKKRCLSIFFAPLREMQRALLGVSHFLKSASACPRPNARRSRKRDDAFTRRVATQADVVPGSDRRCRGSALNQCNHAPVGANGSTKASINRGVRAGNGTSHYSNKKNTRFPRSEAVKKSHAKAQRRKGREKTLEFLSILCALCTLRGPCWIFSPPRSVGTSGS